MHLLASSLQIQVSPKARFKPMPDVLTLNSVSQSSIYTYADSKEIIEVLLKRKRSEHTRRAYSNDLKDFFATIAPGRGMSSVLANEFLRLPKPQAVAIVVSYRDNLFERGLSPATVNRRMSAIKSLVELGQVFEICSFDLDLIQNEKVKPYRDTKGVDVSEIVRVFQAIDRSTLFGKRDYAIMRLLWANALRRGEVVSLDVKHFLPGKGKLEICGKGRNQERELVTISEKTIDAIAEWLNASNASDKPSEPLFIALDDVYFGQRLTGESVRQIVVKYCKKADISQQMSPHRVRHSSITQALNESNGNIRNAQKLSRHADPRTVMIYDDNRLDVQGELTKKLDALV